MIQRLELGARQALISVIAAFIAYTPTHFIGLHQGFWSAITAIAVAQSKFKDTEVTARKQFVGAAIGGVAAIVLISALGENLAVYAFAVVTSILMCWILGLGDSAQLAGITATIILLVPHQGSAALMMFSRLTEVGWGVCAGVLVVWVQDLLFTTRAPKAPGPEPVLKKQAPIT